MRAFNPWLLLVMAACWPGTTCAQLQLLPDHELQRVFAGDARKITVIWHNAGDKTAGADVRTRLYQASSATAAPLSEKAWRKIEILPGQTVLESAAMDFPAVNAETHFLIQWLEGTNQVLGKTEVLVYPTNLLSELKPLLGDANFGVLDPNNELKPLLKTAKVDFIDLGETVLEDFHGKLAIIGLFDSKAQMREGLPGQIEKLAASGAAVVWIQPPDKLEPKLKPTFYSVPSGKGTVVVAQAKLCYDLENSPSAQLNLIRLAELALRPEPPSLPQP